MLHGDSVVQIWTLVTGAALAGPEFGTARRPPPVGDVLGDPLGDVVGLADADGEVRTPVIGPLPRLARMMTPTIPSRITITAAIAAGMSQDGRSDGGPRPQVGRGTGRGAGAAGGRAV